ncbi:MAG: STAS domain-containing protein [Candidatus Brocadiia bacterium]
MFDIEIDIEKVDKDIALMTLRGSLDSTTDDKLSEALNKLIKDNVYRFVIDLSGVSYIGSPGIGVFISVIDILQSNKGTIVFIYPKPNVKATFKMFKLSAFYSIAKDKETAVKELKALCK